jgi:hypothetical protein
VRYRYDLLDPGALFAQVRQQVAYGVCPKQVLSHAATRAIALGLFHVFALRTKLVEARFRLDDHLDITPDRKKFRFPLNFSNP